MASRITCTNHSHSEECPGRYLHEPFSSPQIHPSCFDVQEKETKTKESDKANAKDLLGFRIASEQEAGNSFGGGRGAPTRARNLVEILFC